MEKSWVKSTAGWFLLNKKVVLLTKHDGDLEESLMKFHLTKGNFDEIILIKPDSKKSDYIKHENAKNCLIVKIFYYY